MTEDFLHFVWRHKLWDFIDATTTDGEQIVIRNTGTPNNMDGPDFLEACVVIDGKEWNGHVEIHVKTSEWHHHGHQEDRKYQPVILHVVFEDDNPNALAIPTLSLKGKIQRSYLDNYQALIANQQWLACGDGLKQFPTPKLSLWLQRMLIERFEQKHEQLQGVLVAYNNHWDHVMFIWVMRAFGYYYNADQMVTLAHAIPYKAIMKAQSEYELEVLLQGMAGFLSETLADQQWFNHAKQLYDLQPLSNHIWVKKVRPPVRPPFIFESIAKLYAHKKSLFSHILHLFEQYIETGEVPFTKTTELSEAQQLHLWLNAFIPVLFLHAKKMQNEQWINALWDLLSLIKADKNQLMVKFKNEGVDIKNAAQSQALIHLHRNYCSLKKCLNCPVGLSLVKTV